MTTASTATPSALQQKMIDHHKSTLAEWVPDGKTTFIRLSAKTPSWNCSIWPFGTKIVPGFARSNCSNSHGSFDPVCFNSPWRAHQSQSRWPISILNLEQNQRSIIIESAVRRPSVARDVPCLHTSTRRPKRLTGLQRNGSSSSCIYGECPSRNL